MQLEQRIKKELEENPVLELTGDSSSEEAEAQEDQSSIESENDNNDEFSLEDYMDDDDIPEYRLASNNYSKDDRQIDIPSRQAPASTNR
ncbi:MAG: hypothetical protein AB2L24_11465 [Mangrovibacterium sp.]